MINYKKKYLKYKLKLEKLKQKGGMYLHIPPHTEYYEAENKNGKWQLSNEGKKAFEEAASGGGGGGC